MRQFLNKEIYQLHYKLYVSRRKSLSILIYIFSYKLRRKHTQKCVNYLFFLSNGSFLNVGLNRQKLNFRLLNSIDVYGISEINPLLHKIVETFREKKGGY